MNHDDSTGSASRAAPAAPTIEAEPSFLPRSQRRVEDLDVVAFDADDTLWMSEDTFQRAEAWFAELVGPYAPEGIDVLDALHATERDDLPIQGYGVKAFTISMVRAAVRMTDGAVPSSVIGKIVDMGQQMLIEPVRLLPGVAETLHRMGLEVRLALITKGDLVHQLRKVETSGLAHHFADVEVVREKDPEVYRRIMQRMCVPPDRFLMVGNSVKSDVLPVIAAGGHAVHVPYHLTWELERVDQHDEDVAELDSIIELPAWLGL